METQPAKRIYTVGEAFDPAGMELELSYSNGDIEHVAYGEDTKADFTFDPALGTVFDEEARSTSRSPMASATPSCPSR